MATEICEYISLPFLLPRVDLWPTHSLSIPSPALIYAQFVSKRWETEASEARLLVGCPAV